MKILIVLFSLLFSLISFANNFNCYHEDSMGQKYLVEYINSSICLKKLNPGEVKFDLFPAPEPEEKSGSLVIRDDAHSFRLILPDYPMAGAPVYGEITQADENGEVIQETMRTICE